MSTLRFRSFASTLTALLLSSPWARADDAAASDRSGDPVPAGYRVERSGVGESIALAGGVTALGAYAVAAYYGALGSLVCAGLGYCSPSPAWSFAPVVGPLKLAHDESPSGYQTFLRVDGALQGAGLGMLAVGLVVQLASPARLERVRSHEGRVRVAPLFGSGRSGVVVNGTF